MEVLEADLHGPDIDAKLLEAREEEEEVVWCKSELGRLDTVRCEVQGSKGEGRRERVGRGRC